MIRYLKFKFMEIKKDIHNYQNISYQSVGHKFCEQDVLNRSH